ncbi:DUF3307 domain-containing protein [Thermoanaerobacter thermocopriae]|uniref:DUF3307 domain-containing protein n=1 Tax=Thermoanaerobacter thermocopriae TaxID=29350 RepID=UPI00048BA817|nr:DUF3307 domain-containing protein [Thermoanaerobacter thermocopriae]
MNSQNFVLTLLFLFHGLSDYLFQTDSIVLKKSKGLIEGFIKHFLVVLVLNLLVLPFFKFKAILFLIFLSFVHIIIDYLKYKIAKTDNVYFFIGDQIFHFLTIYFISLKLIDVFCFSYPEIYFKIFAVFCIYIYVIFGGAIFIKYVLLSLNIHISKMEITSSGKIIGMLERTLMMTLIAVNQIAAASFVIGAKSIARYKELDNKDFAEYYLIGTMLSMLIALFGGLLIKAILKI